jgi:hypothetical protein
MVRTCIIFYIYMYIIYKYIYILYGTLVRYTVSFCLTYKPLLKNDTNIARSIILYRCILVFAFRTSADVNFNSNKTNRPKANELLQLRQDSLPKWEMGEHLNP